MRPPESGPRDSAQASAGGDSHLVDLADGWRSWRTICLRGAGFPVEMLERIAAPDAVAAIDDLVERIAAYESVRERALEECKRRFKGADAETRRLLRRALRPMIKGRAPDSLPDIPEIKAVLEPVVAAADEKEAAHAEAEARLAEALARISGALREVGRDPRFREAVTWQNRRALHESVDVLLRTPAGERNKQARRHEQLVAGYLQRYCAKNETIGFFGPLGWAYWTDTGPPLAQRPAGNLVAARRVHFEHWAVAALAETLSRNPVLRQWLPPRLDPRLRLEGAALVNAEGRRRAIRAPAARVLAACDGKTAAVDIADALAAAPESGIETKEAVYAILDQAARAGVLSWTLDVPVGPAPERSLRVALHRVGDPALRAELLRPLDRLEAARDAAAVAAGNAEALDRALGKLESTFTSITGEDPYRHPGQVYAGRGLVYEDCRRGTEIELGPEIRGRIGPPLALVLQSARWFTHAIAEAFGAHLNRIYPQLRALFAPEPVPAAALEFLFRPEHPAVPGIVQETVRELMAKWASILVHDPAVRHARFSTADLRGPVSSAFAAPCPGWSAARHHSADILIAADDEEKLRSGEYQCVLGEVHLSETMLMRHVIQEMHPRPEELAEAYRRDVDRSHIFRVVPRDFRGHRKMWDPFLPGDYQLAWEDGVAWRAADEVLRITDLVIEESADGLVVRTRDGSRVFPATVYFERLLWLESFTEFTLLPPSSHAPRISLDGLVIRRESWRFPCSDLDFPYEKTEAGRFIGARRWARREGLPRWVFVRVPQEFKPVYADLESPVSVEILSKLARRGADLAGPGAELNLTEMLPTPAQSWLMDSQGHRYTSELRIVAVDPRPWRP